MATTNINTAVNAIIEQVPDADKYTLDLLKEKVEFLKDLTPPIPTTWVDPTEVGSTGDAQSSDHPVYDGVNSGLFQ